MTQKVSEKKLREDKVNLNHRFVVHEHRATNLHWDLRLAMPKNLNGGEIVLKSWAVPKGPPNMIGDRRLAIQTSDHPLDYISFVGVIPEGSYGAGRVSIWDEGKFVLLKRTEREYKFILRGKKLTGFYALFHPRTFDKNQYLFVKNTDNVGGLKSIPST